MYKPKSQITTQTMIPVLRGTSSSSSLTKKKAFQNMAEDLIVTGGASNQKIECFSFNLQDVIGSDNTVAWTYTIPILSPNQKQLFLVTQGFTTILQDFVGSDFPQTIYITLDNFAGYIGMDGTATQRIIVLRLVDINTVNNSGMITRDLIYKNETKANWSLGLRRQLTFRITLDDNNAPLALPLQNPLGVVFKIIHMSI